MPNEAYRLAFEYNAKHRLKITRRPELKAMVVEQLKESWSPEIIAGQAFPFFWFLMRQFISLFMATKAERMSCLSICCECILVEAWWVQAMFNNIRTSMLFMGLTGIRCN